MSLGRACSSFKSCLPSPFDVIAERSPAHSVCDIVYKNPCQCWLSGSSGNDSAVWNGQMAAIKVLLSPPLLLQWFVTHIELSG